MQCVLVGVHPKVFLQLHQLGIVTTLFQTTTMFFFNTTAKYAEPSNEDFNLNIPPKMVVSHVGTCQGNFQQHNMNPYTSHCSTMVSSCERQFLIITYRIFNQLFLLRVSYLQCRY